MDELYWVPHDVLALSVDVIDKHAVVALVLDVITLQGDLIGLTQDVIAFIRMT